MIYFIGEWVSLHPVLAGAAIAVSCVGSEGLGIRYKKTVVRKKEKLVIKINREGNELSRPPRF